MARRSRPRRRQDRFTPLQAGLLLVGISSVLLLLGFTKTIPFLQHYEVRAVFQDARTGIKKGSPVRIAGVDAGKVTGLEPGPGGTALVTMRLKDQARPIHQDATMRIRPRLFLEGNFFVDVRPGTGARPELQDGDTIPLAQTEIAVQTDEVLATFDRDTRKDLQTTLSEVGRAFGNGGAAAVNASFPDWAPGFTALAQVMDAARGEQPGDLAGAVRETGAFSSALAERDGDLRSLLTNLNRAMGALAAEQAGLRGTVRGLDETLTTAPPALGELETALPPLRRLVTSLDESSAIGPGALRQGTAVVGQLAGLAGPAELPRLARLLTPAVEQLSAVQPPLRTFFRLLEPVSRCTSRNIVPVLEKEIPDGPNSTGEPAWQDFVRFPVGLAGASGSFDANGHHVRYQTGQGENSFTTNVPGFGSLTSIGPNPIGARPKYTQGAVPELRPDVPCETQPVVSLEAPTAPASLAGPRTKRRLEAVDPQALLERQRDAEARLEEGGGR